MHNTQRVHQHAIASLALAFAAAALLGAPRPAGADAERRPADPLGRTVSEVYIKPGWLLQRVPELFAQLELTGSISYGHWPTAPKGRQRPEPPPPPGTRTDAFEFKAGTVREALDAFVAANPVLTWEADSEGRVAIRREPRSKRVETALATTVGTVDARRLANKETGLEDLLSYAWDRVVESATDTGSDWLRSNAHVCPPKWSDFWSSRSETTIQPWQQTPDQTFGDVLKSLAPAGSHSFWYAIEADDQRPLGGSVSKSLTFGIMTGAPMRRKLDTSVLIQCLRQDYAPLHGYRDRRIRIKDAQAELERRRHFDPDEVDPLLVEQGMLAALIPDDGSRSRAQVRWFASLEDRKINEAVFDRVIQMEQLRPGMNITNALVPRSLDGYSEPLLQRWRKLAAEAEEPLIGEQARFILDLHKWFEDGGEASGRRRPLLPGI